MFNYDYGKIKELIKFVKKTYRVETLPQAVTFIFSDEDVMSEFVKKGADLNSYKEADALIDEKMKEGMDFKEIQEEVLKGLINAGFYKEELTQMVDALNGKMEAEVEQ